MYGNDNKLEEEEEYTRMPEKKTMALKKREGSFF